MKKIIWRLIVFLVIVIGCCFFAHRWFTSQLETKKGTVEIFQGASVRQVADLLEIEGIIKDADFMFYYVKLKSKYYTYKEKETDEWYPLRFKHGKFEVEKGTIDEVVEHLNNGENVINDAIKVTIPEGKSIAAIGELFEEKGLFTKEAFLQAVNDKTMYEQYRKTYEWLPEANDKKHYLLEGYLQANTYEFEENTPPEKVIDTMLAQTDHWMVDYQNSKTNLTFDQVITLASVVEAEAKFDEDRPKIAQVFLNRLAKQMPLQSDMTAAYANGEHKVFLYDKDIKIKSPYNTYYVKGLPLGPINSPSVKSFLAVLNPAGSKFNYYYFYARPSGETFYAATWKGHEITRKKYEAEWKELENQKR